MYSGTIDGGAIDNGDHASAGSPTTNDHRFDVLRTARTKAERSPTGIPRVSGRPRSWAPTLSGDTAFPTGSTTGNEIDTRGSGTVTVGADTFTKSCDPNSGTWTDEGYNVGADATCFNGRTGDDDSAGSNLGSLMAPLQNNGGPTDTEALVVGNPAISVIPNPTTGFCPVTADQRGDPSPAGQSCDAGAIQLVAPPTVSGVSPSVGPPDGGTPITITGTGVTGVTGVAAGSNPVRSFTVPHVHHRHHSQWQRGC